MHGCIGHSVDTAVDSWGYHDVRFFLWEQSGWPAGLTGCSLDESDSPNEPTHTPEPSPTPELSPTPTQPPVASPVPGYADPTRWEGRTLNIAAWGGDYQNAQNDAFFKPFCSRDRRLHRGESCRYRRFARSGRIGRCHLGRDDRADGANGPTRARQCARADELRRRRSHPALSGHRARIRSRRRLLLRDHDLFIRLDQHPAGLDKLLGCCAGRRRDDIPPEDLRCLRRYPIGTLEFALLADGVPSRGALSARYRSRVCVTRQDSRQRARLVAGEQGTGRADRGRCGRGRQ